MEKIAITATFTAEPLEKPLGFWMQELEMPMRIEFAPYNQVLQQLLDPSSMLSTNRDGVNVVLVRFEDWQRTGPDAKALNSNQKVERNLRELCSRFDGCCRTVAGTSPAMSLSWFSVSSR